jgi:hypothetical protein
MYVANSALSQNIILGSNTQPVVEIRIYYDKSTGEVDSGLMTQATNLQSILTGSTSIDNTAPNTKIDNHLPTDNITITKIDISDKGEHRSPTQSAWDLARNAANNSTTGTPSTTDAAKIQSTIFTQILDCVMTFTNVASTATTPASTADSTTTQAGTSSNTSTSVASSLTNVGGASSTAGTAAGTNITNGPNFGSGL